MSFATRSTRIFIAGVASVSLTACAGLFQEEDRQRSAARGEPKAQSAQAQAPAQQAERPQQQEQQVAEARPVTHDLVRKVQQELKAQGVDPGPIDGLWGPQTSQALHEFQTKRGLETTAQIDAATLSALGIGETQTALESRELSASAGGTNAGQRERGESRVDLSRGSRAAELGSSRDNASAGGTASAGGSAQTRAPQQDRISAFSLADLNKDGRLDREEFENALKARESGRLGPSASAGTTTRARAGGAPRFDNLDADNDGMLTLAEAAADTRISRNFERADRDNDHRLSREEFQTALQVDRHGSGSPFAAADRNSDGMLNREEFQEALRTRQARGAGDTTALSGAQAAAARAGMAAGAGREAVELERSDLGEQSASAGASGADAQAKAQAAFKQADRDDDGMLSRDEFRNAVKLRQARRQQQEGSAGAGASIEQAAESVFARADRDSDGKLSRQEFQDALEERQSRREQGAR